MDRESLKKRVDEYGRRKVAEKIGMPYQTLSHKLGGFAPIFEEDVKKIVEALGDEK